jgi:hypothetical protein
VEHPRQTELPAPPDGTTPCHPPAPLSIYIQAPTSLSIGQQGGTTTQQQAQTWTKKLPDHPMSYWLSHFILGIGAIVLWDLLRWVYHVFVHR